MHFLAYFVLGLLAPIAFQTQTSVASPQSQGIPPVIDPRNLYSQTTAGKLSPATAGALSRVYVPNVKSGDVYVIDPATFQVVDRFVVGGNPQHIIPSWDLKTLWIAGSAERKLSGILTSIDPKTGKPGATVNVPDAYNLYFTPDGSSAIVVAEALKRLEFRDPQTMKLQYTIATPQCSGINHADYSIDGRYAFFTCEFGGGGIVKIDLVQRSVLGYLPLSREGATRGKMLHGMPQDIRISPDGKLLFVADMEADGVYLIDAATFKQAGFIPTGRGAHGLYPSRHDTTPKLYVTNRGTHMGDVKANGPGSVSTIDFATHKIEKTWSIPGGGSPDMGNVSADGKCLWLSGRFSIRSFMRSIRRPVTVKTIPVGTEPHGLTIWPQPGRYSLGHTGVM